MHPFSFDSPREGLIFIAVLSAMLVATLIWDYWRKKQYGGRKDGR